MANIPEEALLALAVKNKGGGGGGTTNYNDLSNQPQIGGVTLIGNKSASDLGLADADTVQGILDGQGIDSFSDVETALADKVNKVNGKGLSTNDYDDTEKAAVADAVKDVKVDGQSCLDANRNAIVQITIPTEYEYTVSKVDNLNLKVTTKQNDVVTDETTYTLTGWSEPVDIDGHIQLNYNISGGTWSVKTLVASTDYPAEQTWTWVYNQTPSVPVLTFEEAENHIGLSSAYADLKTNKQDTLTFDDTPTENSNNPVKSGGIYTALASKVNTENGKGLSTNDYSDTEKAQVATNASDIDSLKSGLTSLDNEVNGDATTYPYADVITIEDAVPSNLADCSVKIEPVQDLHGYDKPWVGGAGKNKLPMTVDGIKSLNTIGTWVGNVYSLHGATIEMLVDSDSNVIGFKSTGTPSNNLIFYLYSGAIKAGSYVLNGCPEGGGQFDKHKIDIQKTPIDGTIYAFDTGSGKDFTLSEDVTAEVRIVIYTNETNNLTFYPMIRLATETDATFAPYTNICPISGHTEASVQRDGKNLLNLSQLELFNQNRYVHFKENEYLSVKPNITYTLSYKYGGGDGKVYGYDVSGNRTTLVESIPNNPKYVTFTTASDTVKIAFYSLVSSDASISLTDAEIQFELGSTATPYVPYAGKTYTISLGDTIYGGTVDFDSGVMTVTHALVEYDGGNDEEWVKDAVSDRHSMSIDKPDGTTPTTVAICNQFIPKSGSGTPPAGYFYFGTQRLNFLLFNETSIEDWKDYLTSNHLQVCYELATPTTIQLTPQQIQLLKGQNTLTASTGDISVTINGVSGAIGQVQEQVNELVKQLPNAPTTDGSYVLKVTVSDGEPVYSWESAE